MGNDLWAIRNNGGGNDEGSYWLNGEGWIEMEDVADISFSVYSTSMKEEPHPIHRLPIDAEWVKL